MICFESDQGPVGAGSSSAQRAAAADSDPQGAGPGEPFLKTLQRRVSHYAHWIWLREGRPEGKALDHWLRAERSLLPREQLPPILLLHRR